MHHRGGRETYETSCSTTVGGAATTSRSSLSSSRSLQACALMNRPMATSQTPTRIAPRIEVADLRAVYLRTCPRPADHVHDICPAGGDERRDDRVEAVAARVSAASTRSQVNFAFPANQVNVRKSNQVNLVASRGSFLEPAPRSSRTQPPDVVVGSPPIPTDGRDGWRGRIRTFDLLIQRTPDVAAGSRCELSGARTRILSVRRVIRLNVPDPVR